MSKKDFTGDFDSSIEFADLGESKSSVVHMDAIAEASAVTSNVQAEVLAAEINMYKAQTVQNIIEIGKRLRAAKAILPQGEYLAWLNHAVEFSQSTAYNFMKIAEEYGDLHPAVNLGYSKMIALLAVPAEEREDFLAAKHITGSGKEKAVEELSKRELDSAIKALAEAKREKDSLAEKLNIAIDKVTELEQQSQSGAPDADTLAEMRKEAEHEAFLIYEGIIKRKDESKRKLSMQVFDLQEKLNQLDGIASIELNEEIIKQALSAFTSTVQSAFDNYHLFAPYMSEEKRGETVSICTEYLYQIIDRLEEMTE